MYTFIARARFQREKRRLRVTRITVARLCTYRVFKIERSDVNRYDGKTPESFDVWPADYFLRKSLARLLVLKHRDFCRPVSII